MTPLHILVLTFFVFILPTVARLVNVTIDDVSPAIQYAPAGNNQWTARTQDCYSCTTAPDVTQVYNHTWHDATYDFFIKEQSAPETLAIRFNGTAIYAYGILSTLATQTADMYMFIDDFYNPVANFKFNGSEPDGSGSYIYNALLYSNTSLPPGEHSFLLQNGQGGGGLSSLILFDYLIYTTEVEDPVSTASSTPTFSATPTPSAVPSTSPTEFPVTASSTPPASNPLVKVLPIVVAIVVVAAILFCLWWWRRQKGREALALEAGQARPDPFPIPSSFIPAPGPSLGGVGTSYSAHACGQYSSGSQSVADSVDTLGLGVHKKALLLSPAAAFDALPLYERGDGIAARSRASTSGFTRSKTVRSGRSQLGISPPAYTSEFGCE